MFCVQLICLDQVMIFFAEQCTRQDRAGSSRVVCQCSQHKNIVMRTEKHFGLSQKRVIIYIHWKSGTCAFGRSLRHDPKVQQKLAKDAPCSCETNPILQQNVLFWGRTYPACVVGCCIRYGRNWGAYDISSTFNSWMCWSLWWFTVWQDVPDPSKNLLMLRFWKPLLQLMPEGGLWRFPIRFCFDVKSSVGRKF